ncbi:uncharacterized protein V6R79_002812 [Siganus canaliculatus]
MEERDFSAWTRVEGNRTLQNTCDMSGKQQSRKFKWLMLSSAAFTVLSLVVLLSVYRPDETFWFSTRYHQAPSESQLPPQPTACPRCEGEQIASTGQMVEVNQTKTLLIASYQEHRTKEKEVRVLAVALRRESVSYRCLLCCQNQLHTSTGVSYIHKDHFDFAYGTADIMCPIPPGCESPSHVAVISEKGNNAPENLTQTFLEVKNQEQKKDSFQYHFTTCISTMFNFTNVLQLVQSLEALQLLGVDRVVIYQTNNSPETQRVLDYYTHKGLVEVIPWSLSRFLKLSRGFLPEHDPGDIHYFGQIPALNDCLYRYMYQTKYMALHDIDELILPQSVNSWSELLPLLEKKYGADKCYMFENNVFPNTVHRPPPGAVVESPQSWQFVPGMNILSHLYHEPIISDTHYSNFKILVNPRAVFSPSVHGLLSSQNGCSWVDRNVARMYHTRGPRQPKLTPDKLIYDGRLLHYSVRFTPTVTTVLMESGLLPADLDSM